MKNLIRLGVALTAICLGVMLSTSGLAATSGDGGEEKRPGGVFVTGHDPDFHAVSGNTTGARNIIKRAVEYVTYNKENPNLLLVTDVRPKGGGFIDSRRGISTVYSDYDVADYGSGAAGVLDLRKVDFSRYDAIIVASDFGGWLRQEEVDVLMERQDELIEYVNNGGGLIAFAEDGHHVTKNRFGFLPFVVSGHSKSQTEVGIQVTEAGLAMGLTNYDVNGSASHCVFLETGGMDIIDFDRSGQILSLATRSPISEDGVVIVDAPVLTAVPDREPNEYGWYNEDVTVTFTATDKDPIVELTEPVTVSTEGEGQVVRGTATDSEGQTGTGSLKLNIDKTAPVTEADASEIITRDGVTFDLTATDNLSGLLKTEYRVNGGEWIVYDGPVTLAEEARYLIEYRSTDKAGNVEDTKSLLLIVDQTAPVTDIALPPLPGGGGSDWYTDIIVIDPKCRDQIFDSGNITQVRINGGDWITVTEPLTFGDGEYVLEYRSIDPAGNVEETQSVTFQVDTAAPTTSATLPESGAGGWHTDDVTVSLDGADNLSGLSGIEYQLEPNGPWITYREPIVLTKNCTCKIRYRGTDEAGNVEEPNEIEIKIDKTPPTLKLTLDNTILWPPNHKPVPIHVTVEAFDEDSGIESVVLTSITSNEAEEGAGDGHFTEDIQEAEYGTFDTDFLVRVERSGLGRDRIYTVTYTATDKAGNVIVATATITVPHDLRGGKDSYGLKK